ncbi:MAG: hypothetical protein A2776_01755 [Candidatus Levybacteria bacterium RIFCSPHIGHO2_01_FULL_40_10]|nr:MAG: hypothetical protein A2776_01755 [Candidatus Levybacteria bacterium RIFCSPHIGHO2_01_FULL_40_10]
MKETQNTEIIISTILILLLIFFLNPLHILMPDPLLTMMIIFLLILFAIFSSFIFKEKVKDEREALHRFIGARFAYLSGTVILVVGIILQSLNHNVDVFLVFTLIIMILSKIVGFMYAKSKH